MNLALIIYLAELADPLKAIFVIIAFILGTVMFFMLLARLGTYEDDIKKKEPSKIIPCLIWAASILTLIAILYPSSRTIYLMLGADVLEDVAKKTVESPMYQDVIDILELKIGDIKKGLENGE